jgi:hypothetical protein
MERYCSTGQSPQRALAPTEEEGRNFILFITSGICGTLPSTKSPRVLFNLLLVSWRSGCFFFLSRVLRRVFVMNPYETFASELEDEIFDNGGRFGIVSSGHLGC